MAGRVWLDKDDATLTELWTTKPVISTAEIGRRMNKSKNAVVGRSNRLDLPARPSPIRRSAGGPQSPLPPRVRDRPTLAPLASLGVVAGRASERPAPVLGGLGGAAALSAAFARAAVARMPKPLPPLTFEAPIIAPRPVIAAPVTKPAQPKPYGRVVTCCWPIGEPGVMRGPNAFRFCDADAVPNKPYCAGHARLAYIDRRKRPEDMKGISEAAEAD